MNVAGTWAHMAMSVDGMWTYHVTDPWEKPSGTPRRSPTLLINVGLI
jgi:hypothetical protein